MVGRHLELSLYVCICERVPQNCKFAAESLIIWLDVDKKLKMGHGHDNPCNWGKNTESKWMAQRSPDWNLSGTGIVQPEWKRVSDRESEDHTKATENFRFCISGEAFPFPIYFSSNYRNPQEQVTQCPIPTQMAFFNKGTVSCREYHISLIVLQIPFLIKIKIFILTTDDAAWECSLEADAVGTTSLILWRSNSGEENLQQLILFCL